MKRTVFLALFLAIQTVYTDDLTLQDGTVYRNVTIIGADPDRMLIAHDGGGCQVAYTNLAPDSLTAEQKEAVTEGLKAHVARETRQEELWLKAEEQRLARETFEAEQREKGLIEFEGHWMTPAEKQDLLALRELQRIEKKKAEAELARQKVELENERLRLAEEKARLEKEYRERRSSDYTFYYGYYPTVRYSHGNGCACSRCSPHGSGHRDRHHYRNRHDHHRDSCPDNRQPSPIKPDYSRR